MSTVNLYSKVQDEIPAARDKKLSLLQFEKNEKDSTVSILLHTNIGTTFCSAIIQAFSKISQKMIKFSKSFIKSWPCPDGLLGHISVALFLLSLVGLE